MREEGGIKQRGRGRERRKGGIKQRGRGRERRKGGIKLRGRVREGGSFCGYNNYIIILSS